MNSQEYWEKLKASMTPEEWRKVLQEHDARRHRLNVGVQLFFFGMFLLVVFGVFFPMLDALKY